MITFSAVILAAGFSAAHGCEIVSPQGWYDDLQGLLQSCVQGAVRGDSDSAFAVAAAVFYRACDMADPIANKVGDAWLAYASERGQPDALTWNADQLIYGVPIGIEPEMQDALTHAIPLLEKAAAAGSGEASFRIFELWTSDPRAAPQLRRKPHEYLHQAIDREYPAAIGLLARVELHEVLNARTAAVDEKMRWLGGSESAGIAAQMRLANLLDGADLQRARHHAELAAYGGDERAILLLSRGHAEEWFGTGDVAEALAWNTIDAFGTGGRQELARAENVLAKAVPAERDAACTIVRRITTSTNRLPLGVARSNAGDWNAVDRFARKCMNPAALISSCIDTDSLVRVPAPPNGRAITKP